MLAALALIAIVVAGHVRDAGRDRPLARRDVQGAAPHERDDAGRARSSSAPSSTSRPACAATCSPTTRASSSPTTAAAADLELTCRARRGSAPPSLRARVERDRRATSTPTSRDYTEPLIHGTRRQSVLAATTEGKQRLDALRAEFAALSRAAAARSPPQRRADVAGAAPRAWSCSPPPAPSLSVALLVAARRSACTASCCCPSAASPSPPSASPTATSTPACRPPASARSASSARSFNAMAAALAAREEDLRVPDRPAAGHPRPHDDDDLGQGPRRPLPAGQRRSWRAGDGPGRRRRASAAPTTSCSRPTSPPRSASPTSRSCAPARPAEYERDAATGGRAFQHRQVPAQGRRRRRLRHRHDGHRRHRAPARARRGGRGLALEVRVPGQHEPRDPHAAQRRDRDDRAAARRPSSRRSSASTRRPPPTPARRCSTSSTTSSTSRRSRPASSSSTTTTSTCARRSRTPARCSPRRRTARASS